MVSSQGLEDTSRVVYSYTTSSEEISEGIANYRPEAPPRLWNDAVQHFTRSAVTEFARPNVGEARKYMSAVAHLAMWTQSVACLSLERDIVFAGQNIDSFIAQGTLGKTDNRRRVLRLRLLRIAAELSEFEPERRELQKFSTNPDGEGPYAPSYVVRLRNQATTRSTAQRRHNWTVILALAAGCALMSSEIVHVRIDDIEVNDDCVRVRVRGKRARTVICGASWENDLRKAVQSPEVTNYLFIGNYDRRDTRVGDFADQRPVSPSGFIDNFIRNAADEGATFTVGRLRATWIVDHLRRHTNLIALKTAIGDKGLKALVRLSEHLDTPTEPDLVAMFRGEASP